MLSKKMAFSLMRLITIFALAFVAPSAMATEFGVSLLRVEDLNSAELRDVSHDGGIQVQRPQTSIRAVVKFDRAVILSETDMSTSGYDVDGVYIPRVALAATDPITPTPAATEITLNITTTAETSKVTIKIAAGIASADPFNDDTSKALDVNIFLVAADAGGPTVYSIERTDNPLLPVTSATLQIIITLSEKPKAFTKDHVSVSNAIHGDPVALEAIPETDNLPSTGRDGMLYPYVLTITPKYENKNNIVVKVKAFEDTVLPTPNRYTPPSTEAGYRKGTDELAIKVGNEVLTAKTEGFEVVLAKDKIIPNQAGNGVGTPGATHVIPQADIDAMAIEEKKKSDADTATAAKAADTSVRIPRVGQIYISEIMFVGGGSLPQWIEISNGSRTEQVNLSGWTLTVDNAAADADVSVGATVTFTIPEGTRIDPSGQHATPSTVLVVTEQGRNNLDGTKADGQVLNLWTDRWVKLILLGVTKRRYTLLSDMAFKITLAPPAALITTPAAADATDVVGNLGVDGTATWALPMAEGHARSSIIRRHVAVSVGPGTAEGGEMMESWVLASDTGFAQSTHLRAQSYYGLPTDVGTPGFRAGGALPVELSQFRPERQKGTGAVVIAWSTQSELNNAGFFIKRSQQRSTNFKVINAAMIPGAGTTSEKQFYTYEDTTAQANVVYYYQIEDVSLDGDRRTLTRGIRLKGHVGAAGKATVLWGALKVLHE